MNWCKEEVIRRLNKLAKIELLAVKRLVFDSLEYPVGFEDETVEKVAERLIAKGWVESMMITSLQKFYGHPSFGA